MDGEREVYVQDTSSLNCQHVRTSPERQCCPWPGTEGMSHPGVYTPSPHPRNERTVSYEKLDTMKIFFFFVYLIIFFLSFFLSF